MSNDQNNLPSGNSIAGMVCGICSIVFSWVPVVGLVLSIVGIIFGNKGMKAANEGTGSGKGMGIAGLVTGIIDLVFSGLYTYWWIVAMIFISEVANAFSY